MPPARWQAHRQRAISRDSSLRHARRLRRHPLPRARTCRERTPTSSTAWKPCRRGAGILDIRPSEAEGAEQLALEAVCGAPLDTMSVAGGDISVRTHQWVRLMRSWYPAGGERRASVGAGADAGRPGWTSSSRPGNSPAAESRRSGGRSNWFRSASKGPPGTRRHPGHPVLHGPVGCA